MINTFNLTPIQLNSKNEGLSHNIYLIHIKAPRFLLTKEEILAFIFKDKELFVQEEPLYRSKQTIMHEDKSNLIKDYLVYLCIVNYNLGLTHFWSLNWKIQNILLYQIANTLDGLIGPINHKTFDIYFRVFDQCYRKCFKKTITLNEITTGLALYHSFHKSYSGQIKVDIATKIITDEIPAK